MSGPRPADQETGRGEAAQTGEELHGPRTRHAETNGEADADEDAEDGEAQLVQPTFDGCLAFPWGLRPGGGTNRPTAGPVDGGSRWRSRVRVPSLPSLIAGAVSPTTSRRLHAMERMPWPTLRTVAARRPSNEPLLLIAGLGQGIWIWRDLLPLLEREHPVIAFEAQGTGRLAHLPPRRTIEEMAADARGLLDAPAHVLGFSMGGYIALMLALTTPEVVTSLLLLGTAGGGPGRVPRPRYVADAMTEALGLPDAEFALRTMPFTVSPAWVDAHPERFEKMLAARIENPTPVELLDAHVEACYRFYEQGCPVERIQVPALVVHGNEDLIVPVENGRRLAKRLPRAEYVELPGRGHNLMFEDPESLARLALDFLA